MHNSAPSTVVPPIGMPHLPAFDPVVSGGYHRAPASQLMTALASLSSKAITPRQFRIYAGTLEMGAIREAAKSEAPPRFTLKELLRLIGSPNTKRSQRAIRADLNHLQRIGLLVVTESKIGHARNLESLDPTQIPEYQRLEAIYGDDFFRNHRRMVPVPRRVLRAIARGEFTPAMAKVATVVMLRCLYWHKGTGYRVDGRYKVTDAARLCGVSESTARAARRKRIEMGWLGPDESPEQWNLKHWGGRDSINLDWSEPPRVQILHPGATYTGGPPQENATYTGGPSSQIPSLVNEHPHTTNPSRGRPPKPPVCRVDFQSGNEKEENKITITVKEA